MKYMKSYENYQPKFKINDYVFVTYNGCEEDIYKIEDLLEKKTPINSFEKNDSKIEYLLRNIEDKNDYAWVPENNILRIATKPEIDMIKLKKASAKYNI